MSSTYDHVEYGVLTTMKHHLVYQMIEKISKSQFVPKQNEDSIENLLVPKEKTENIPFISVATLKLKLLEHSNENEEYTEASKSLGKKKK